MEGFGYRQALKVSKNVVKGHTWTTLWHLLGLAVVIFLPSFFLAGATDEFARYFDMRLFPAMSIVGNTCIAFSLMLFTLTTIVLYGELKKLPK